MSDLYELIAIIESELGTSYYEYIEMILDLYFIVFEVFKYLNMNLARLSIYDTTTITNSTLINRDTSSYFQQQKLFIDLWMIYRKFITDYL